MNPELIFSTLTEIFSSGFIAEGCKITCKEPIDIKVYKRPNNGWVEIDFGDNKPIVRYEKNFGFIKPRVSIPVIGITFKPDGGVLKLEGFFDIPFGYSK